MPSAEPDVYVLSSSDSIFANSPRRVSPTKVRQFRGAASESTWSVWSLLVGASVLCAIMILGAALFVSKKQANLSREGEARAWNVVGGLLSQLQDAQSEIQGTQDLHVNAVRALAEEEKRSRNLDEDLQDSRRMRAGLVVESEQSKQKWQSDSANMKTQLEEQAALREQEASEAKTTMSRLERESVALVRENETMQQRNERLVTELAEAQRYVLNLQAERDQLVGETQRLRSSESALVSENSRLRSCNASLECEIKRLESCLNELRNHVNARERDGEHHTPRDRRP